MKRILVYLLVFALLACITPWALNSQAASALFTDVNENAYYYKDLEYIVTHPYKIMEGYNGKFCPLDTLTLAQYIKCLTVLAGWKSKPLEKGEPWTKQYIDRALEIGLVSQGEFKDYNKGITRAQMALLTMRSLPLLMNETPAAYDLEAIKKKILDFSEIPADLVHSVCQAYQMGILVGGNDKKFRPNDILLRAQAASVIHKILNPKVRPAVSSSPSPTPVADDMWTDEEFEAYVKSDDANMVCVSKFENRKIYWKDSKGKPVLMSEKNNPGVNDMIYNVAKVMQYGAKKTGAQMDLIYSNDIADGVVILKLNIHNIGLVPFGNIALWIYNTPQRSSTADEFMPGKQKELSSYSWILSGLFKDIPQGFKYGMDRTKYKWSEEKYEIILKQACIATYGEIQGAAFYIYALKEYTQVLSCDYRKYEKSYIGKPENCNFEVIYHFPDSVPMLQFWTTRPEVRQ